MSERKPHGYWQDFKNVELELKKVIEQNGGEIPSQDRIRELGFSSISTAIIKYHGGIKKVIKRMGLEASSHDSEYWKDSNNVRREFEQILKKHPDLEGRIPSTWWLNNNGYGYVSYGILNNYGSITFVRGLFNQPLLSEQVESYNKYKSKKSVLDALKKIWEEHPEIDGQLPSSSWLRKNNYIHLDSSISRHHGGAVKLREEIGLDWKKRGNKYKKGELRDWNYFSIELRRIIEQHKELSGKLPRTKWLNEHGHGALVSALNHAHGGRKKVSERLGLEDLGHTNRRVYKDEEYLKNKLKKIIESNPQFEGRMPTQNWLIKNGHSAIVFATRKYHGGFNNFRIKMGETLLRKPRGYYQDWDNAEKELQKAIQLNSGKFPTKKRFAEMGMSTLGVAISEYHGGFPEVKKKLGYEDSRKPRGYWKEWINVERILRNLFDKIGHFPTQKEFVNLGYGVVSQAINAYHGGVIHVKERMFGEEDRNLGESLLEGWVNE